MIYGAAECIASQIGYTHPKAYARLSVRQNHKEDIGYWYMKNSKIIIAGRLNVKGWHNKACEILDVGGVCTCIHCQSNNLLQKILVEYEAD